MLYDMCDSRALDHDAKKPNSSLYFDKQAQALLLSLLFGAEEFPEQAEVCIHELGEEEITAACFCLGHTAQGVHRNLWKRRTMLLLRVEQEANSGRYSAVSAARPEVVQDNIHNYQAETIRSDISDRWFREFEGLKTKQNLERARQPRAPRLLRQRLPQPEGARQGQQGRREGVRRERRRAFPGLA
ncbi:hypothetical protein CYMTET_12471 [Cymbomonas tetramitiformis]|uniref:Uncharacterized protein n=1 Tax=Cymbomonas tetramitiformis TaxID=36881 RepID=A0AAE0LCE1_9CHLO|nr:hypothetical protein CYMTET_12471 [Cymbomonas tetramitiformis]